MPRPPPRTVVQDARSGPVSLRGASWTLAEVRRPGQVCPTFSFRIGCRQFSASTLGRWPASAKGAFPVPSRTPRSDFLHRTLSAALSSRSTSQRWASCRCEESNRSRPPVTWSGGCLINSASAVGVVPYIQSFERQATKGVSPSRTRRTRSPLPRPRQSAASLRGGGLHLPSGLPRGQSPAKSLPFQSPAKPMPFAASYSFLRGGRLPGLHPSAETRLIR